LRSFRVTVMGAHRLCDLDRVAPHAFSDYISPQLGETRLHSKGRGRAKCDAEAGNKHCAAPVQPDAFKMKA
jgi:hypothetical protein